MASPTSKPRSSGHSKPQTSARRPGLQTPPANADPPEVVDPIWLLKAFGITVVAAFICGYLTLCLLFYQGQWQLVLHPSRSTPAPTKIAGAPFETVRFGVDETASPQLTGWFISAAPGARYAAYTVLYLPSGDGSLVNAVPALEVLHEAGINVFGFDYRGYGQSTPVRPNQERMAEDAASAWQYLTVSRFLPPSRIVLFGDGVGCALAVTLAASHSGAAAVVAELPRPDVIQSVFADPRVKSLPVRTLFHEDFAVSGPVATLKTPKLLLLSSQSNDPSATTAEVDRLASLAASPKIVATLRKDEFYSPIYREQVVRFFDQYLKE